MRRLMPTGECWCGCGASPKGFGFFMSGHDKTAQARVIAEVFGSVPHFLAAFGYAPADANAVSRELQVIGVDARMKAAVARLLEAAESATAAAKEHLKLLEERS